MLDGFSLFFQQSFNFGQSVYCCNSFFVAISRSFLSYVCMCVDCNQEVKTSWVGLTGEEGITHRCMPARRCMPACRCMPAAVCRFMPANQESLYASQSKLKQCFYMTRYRCFYMTWYRAFAYTRKPMHLNARAVHSHPPFCVKLFSHYVPRMWLGASKESLTIQYFESSIVLEPFLRASSFS